MFSLWLVTQLPVQGFKDLGQSRAGLGAVKMMLALALCTLPNLMLVLLGPATLLLVAPRGN